MQRFELSRRAHGSGAVIAVTGELDLAVADRLQAAIEEAREPILVVDLGGCEFVDSTGIAVLFRAHIGFAEEGRRLAVCSLRAQVRRVFEMTGLADGRLLVADPDEILGRPGPR